MTTAIIVVICTIFIALRISDNADRPNGTPKRSDFQWNRSNRWWLP